MRNVGLITLAAVSLYAAAAAACSNREVVPSASGTVARPFALQSNAPSPSPWQPEPKTPGLLLLGSDGSSIWSVGQDPNFGFSAVWHLDIPTNSLTEYPLTGNASQGHAGPNGSFWFCGSGQVGNVSAVGAITYYPESNFDCEGMTFGPDNNLWVTNSTAIDRIDVNGQLSSFPLPVLSLASIATSLTDGLLWFQYQTSSQFGLGTFDTTTDGYNLYPLSGVTGNGGVNTGDDGNAYDVVNSGLSGEIVRVTPLGQVRRFRGLPLTNGLDNVEEDVQTIWFGGQDNHLYGWATKGHSIVDEGVSPTSISYPILGPDQNVWLTGEVFLRRVLTTSPQSATIMVGVRQPFTIAETNCGRCSWTAVSSAPGVASVSRVLAGGFTVKGKSKGGATITVSDKHLNFVQIPIQVK